MIKMSYNEVVAVVEEIVANAPEGYIYINNAGQQARSNEYGHPVTSCDYFNDETGEPSCIVGQFISAIGGGVGWIINVASYAPGVLCDLESRGLLQLDRQATSFLAEIQRHQDRGVTWAESLEKAKAL